MGRKTYSIKILIALFVTFLFSINAHGEAIDLRPSCALNTQPVENQQKPNPVKTNPIPSAKNTDVKKTASKSNKFGILKLLIPGTLK